MVTQVAATRVTALATYDTHTQGRCMYHATCSHAPPSVQASHTERNFGADTRQYRQRIAQRRQQNRKAWRICLVPQQTCSVTWPVCCSHASCSVQLEITAFRRMFGAPARQTLAGHLVQVHRVRC